MKDQLVPTNAELRFKENSELLLRHRLCTSTVRSLDPLQGLDNTQTHGLLMKTEQTFV